MKIKKKLFPILIIAGLVLLLVGLVVLGIRRTPIYNNAPGGQNIFAQNLPKNNPKLVYSEINNRFIYTSPDGSVQVDVKNNNGQVASVVQTKDHTISMNLENTNAADVYKDHGAFYLPDSDASIQYYPIEGIQSRGLKENIILNSRISQRKYVYSLSYTGIKNYKKTKQGDIEFFNKKGEVIFTIPRGVMIDAKKQKSNGVDVSLSKDWFGKLQVTVTPDDKWLDDPARAYPVIVDPSVVVSGGMTATTTQFGSYQRKVAYSASSSSWYTFYTSGGGVFYKKSADGSTWGSAVDVDGGDTNDANPTVWVSGSIIYVSWIDTSTNTVEIQSVDTANSDTLGTKCTSPSLGTLSNSFMVSMEIVSSGVGYFAFSDTGADTEFGIYKITYSGCTFSDVTTGSGLAAGVRPVIVGDTTVTARVFVVYQDGDLSFSAYNGSSWTESNTQIAAVTDSVYSVINRVGTTNVWVLSMSGTTSTNLYKRSGASWSSQTSPWTSETNISGVSLSFVEAGEYLYAHIIKDVTNQAYWAYSPISSISWTGGDSSTSYGFTSGSLSQISSTHSVPRPPQVAMTLLQASNLEFAFQDAATVANQTDILTRIGTNTDAAGTTTLFARLAYLGVNGDTGANATIFGRLGVNTDFSQCTSTGCTNETVFGIIRNLPGKNRNMLSQFGGDGNETKPANCSGTGTVNITTGIHQYGGNCSLGNNSTATLLQPNSTGNPKGALYLFFSGDLTITNNATISVFGWGGNGGNGGNGSSSSGICNGKGGEGGGPSGGNGGTGSCINAAGTPGAEGASSVAGAGGGGGGGASVGANPGGGGGGGGGGAGSNGGNGGTGGPDISTAGTAGENGASTDKLKISSTILNPNFRQNRTTFLLGSFGGGGGGGGATQAGSAAGGAGGGGGGGGVVWIRAHAITNSGTISANGGGKGINGTSSAGAQRAGNVGGGQYGGQGGTIDSTSGGGGGGGAGGGVIYIEAKSVTINASGAINASGGNGGNGGNSNGSRTGQQPGGVGADGFVFVEIVP